MDAWLIYRCTSCNDTWNRPIVERRQVRTIDREFLVSLQANDPKLARRLAFDVEALRRWTRRVEEFDDALVVKNVLSSSVMPARRLEILCSVSEPTALRVDRLLASELHLSRGSIQWLEKTGGLALLPEGSRLRRAVRNGMRLFIDCAAADDRPISMAGLLAGAVSPSR